jgi:hypothetical protein
MFDGGIVGKQSIKKSCVSLILSAILPGFSLASPTISAAAVELPSSQQSSARALGTVKAISGQTLTVTTDDGKDLTVTVQQGAKIARIEPGQTDLKGATVLQFQDLQIGDRVLVRGASGDDGKLLASSVIVMKKGDIAQKQAKEQEDWQKNGVGGLVKAVDPSAGTITLSTSAGPNKAILVKVSSSTVLRRYAPGSVQFDEAKPGPITEIRAGDQLRARGTRSADGAELNAVEAVSGSFRNIAGTVSAIDSAAGTVTVMDLSTKRAVTVKITAESQLRKLPPPMAMRIAARLKGLPAGPAPAGGSGAVPQGQQPGQAAQTPGAGSGMVDLQQAISRLPAAHIADLQKGDAVMIVATVGQAGSDISVITLLAGVEPILTSPEGASILTPWSLSGGGGGGGEGQQQQQQ